MLQVDEPGVWTELGHAQLDGGAVNEAISSYLRSGDSSRYRDVIARSQEANAHGDLVKYLLMVRKKVKESKVSHSMDLVIAQTSSSTCSWSARRSRRARWAVAIAPCKPQPIPVCWLHASCGDPLFCDSSSACSSGDALGSALSGSGHCANGDLCCHSSEG